MTEDAKVFKLLDSGTIALITGEKGFSVFGGKTHFAMYLAWEFLKAGGYVFSNVIVGQLQKDGSWDTNKLPERYVLVTSLSETLEQWATILNRDKNARALLIVDEAATSLSNKKHATEFSFVITSMSTLNRKWNLAVLFCAVRGSLVLRAIREAGKEKDEDSGLLDIRFHKDAAIIEKYAPDLLDAGYIPKEIVVVMWTGLVDAFTVGIADQIARPRETCKPGDWAYDTKAPADFSLGTVGKKKFNWLAFVQSASKIWSDYAPQKMVEFFQNVRAARDDVKAEAGGGHDIDQGSTGPKDVKDEIMKRLDAGENPTDIAEALGVHKSLVYRYRRMQLETLE